MRKNGVNIVSQHSEEERGSQHSEERGINIGVNIVRKGEST